MKLLHEFGSMNLASVLKSRTHVSILPLYHRRMNCIIDSNIVDVGFAFLESLSCCLCHGFPVQTERGGLGNERRSGRLRKNHVPWYQPVNVEHRFLTIYLGSNRFLLSKPISTHYRSRASWRKASYEGIYS